MSHFASSQKRLLNRLIANWKQESRTLYSWTLVLFVAWFVYQLHSSCSVISLLPFATSNYCNGKLLSNKKPHFTPTLGKYLAIVLEQNNKKPYCIMTQKITRSTAPPLQRCALTGPRHAEVIYNTVLGIGQHMLQIHVCVLSIRG